MGFSDRIMIIKDGKQLLIDTPEKVYYSQNEYIATLFDVVNKVQVEGKEHLYYPHQIHIVNQSPWQAEVENCFFQGGDYLILCRSDKQLFYIKHNEKIEKGKKVFLKVGK